MMPVIRPVRFLPALVILLAGCSFLPPATPEAPDGPTSGRAAVSYPFTGVTTDPNNYDLAYRFNWGDGRLSDWSPFLPPGEPVTMWQSWPEPGRYQVRVQARNALGLTSCWSPALDVAIGAGGGWPDTVIATIPLGFSADRVRALPGGEFVYASEYGRRRIAVVSVADDAVTAVFDGGIGPVGLCNVGDYVFIADYTPAQ
ncbi:MAG TPA: hypothetical protein ENN51_08495 [candidate division WOR-3 bacterium]|uniref:PKD domain-containing protein n=1 Tax=candidate division WOR-3 bacterium TaxID=2052148 RepID=A0A7V0T7F1_UNCW3|nr:hypothetical protein [candidate division WOR-3 bacterium]